MSDLRESGSIEQDADVVLLLHREDYYHVNDPSWGAANPDKMGKAEFRSWRSNETGRRAWWICVGTPSARGSRTSWTSDLEAESCQMCRGSMSSKQRAKK